MTIFGKPKYIVLALAMGPLVLMPAFLALYSTFLQVAWYGWALSFLAIWILLVVIAYRVSAKHCLRIDAKRGLIEQIGYKNFSLLAGEIKDYKVTRYDLNNTVSFDVEFVTADSAVRIDPDFLNHELQGSKIINLLQQVLGEPLTSEVIPAKNET